MTIFISFIFFLFKEHQLLVIHVNSEYSKPYPILTGNPNYKLTKAISIMIQKLDYQVTFKYIRCTRTLIICHAIHSMFTFKLDLHFLWRTISIVSQFRYSKVKSCTVAIVWPLVTKWTQLKILTLRVFFGGVVKIICKTDWHKHYNKGNKEHIISQYEDDTLITINETP